MLSRQRQRRLNEYRKDLETAALIQMNSLPEIPSQIAGLRIATLYNACRDVGGDFYDLHYHSEDRISLVMADVSGKGVPAALFMEYSKTLLSGQIPRYLDPATTLTRTNKEIYRHSKMGMFVTLMLIQVERNLGRLRLASAGHNHQILFRMNTGDVESLSAKGSPLGVFEDTEYLDRVIEYNPGDLLLLYTDGITEAYNESFEEFGEERLFELVRANRDAAPDDLRDEIMRRVGDFTAGVEPADDATMVVVRL
jgi:serine phosphatase RsbU (regulator of sigma subunit)